MSVMINARGTSLPFFKIGKTGVTIFQGFSDPSFTYTPIPGDYWLDATTNSLKVRNASEGWSAPALSNIQIADDQIASAGALLLQSAGNLTLQPADTYNIVLDTAGNNTVVVTAPTGKDISIDPSIGGGTNLFLNGLQFPAADGTSGQHLTTNGLGVLGWTTSSGSVSGPITASSFTQATGRLLGRTTAATGAIEEISPGTNITLSGGLLGVTEVIGLVKGNGTSAFTAATSGVDYLTPEDAAAEYAALVHTHPKSQTLVVSPSAVTGEYTSIATAITAASALTPSATNRIVIRIFPGEYTESPFTIPAYVYLVGLDPWNSAHIKTNDNAVDFITLAANSGAFNVSVTGPTTSGKSVFLQTASGVTKLFWINLRSFKHGISLKPTSGAARCHCMAVVTDSAGITGERVFSVDNPVGTGVFILLQSGPMSVTLTGGYGVYLNGTTAFATLDLCQFRGTSSTSAYIDGGATLKGISTTFAQGTTAIYVGPNGASSVELHGSIIKRNGYTNDIKLESATASVTFSGSATESKVTNTGNGTLIATFSDATKGQIIFGELWIGNKNVQTPLTSYIAADKNTGVVSGGGLSHGAGAREVAVAAGSGFLDTANGLKLVTWGGTTVTIPANTPQARIYVNSSSVVTYSTTSIDKTLNVQLGEATTNATVLTFLSDQTVILPQFRGKLYEYLEHVIGPINVSGGIVTENTTPLKLDVDGSVYYITEEEIITTGGTAVTFTKWYRDGAGGWTSVTGNDTIDVDFYDDGTGTLAAIPTGEYKRDLFLVNSHSGSTDYHLVYGQETFAAEVDAIINPVLPDLLAEHACRLAAIIVLENNTAITSIVDQRPRLGQAAAAATSVTNHQQLSGRDDNNAHTQYQLISAKGSLNGYASLDGSGLVPTAQIPAIAHGNQAGGTLHSAATTSTAGFMSSTDKTKLDGVATGATANSSDATLLNRTNHTGSQAISTVTGLQTALDGKEPTITAGTTGQYWRGDKSWQTLDKTAAGLANVDNTSDLNKPVSTATQTALDGKAPTVHSHLNNVLQTVKVTVTAATGTTTLPQTTPTTANGTLIATLNITPSNVAHAVKIEGTVAVYTSSNAGGVAIAIFRGSTLIGGSFFDGHGHGGETADYTGGTIPFMITDLPNTTSSVAYTVRIGAFHGAANWTVAQMPAAVTWGGAVANSNEITVSEIDL